MSMLETEGLTPQRGRRDWFGQMTEEDVARTDAGLLDAVGDVRPKHWRDSAKRFTTLPGLNAPCAATGLATDGL